MTLPEDSRSAFVARYGSLYEHSPWIAERTWDRGSIPAPDAFVRSADWRAALADALADTLAEATEQEKLALVRAHPDLVGRAALAGELTDHSSTEQSSAGLDQCTADELGRFQALNAAYRQKFGFPFVMAVRGADRQAILAAFERRLDNTTETELQQALVEINRIARLRLDALATSDHRA